MKNLGFLLTLCFLLFSCELKDPVIPNEEELITTMLVTLTPTDGGVPVELKFYDEDGEGGVPPVYTVGNLKANTVYSGKLRLLNELETPAEEITDEVEEEGDQHQFFFALDGLNAEIEYKDTDGNSNPVGLSTILTTSSASSGKLTITLRHQPDKFANGVAAGEIANAGGETDIEVIFNVTIE